MRTDEFNQIVNEQVDRCLNTLLNKTEEYTSNKDRLHIFKAAAELQNITPVQALAGMMAKHTVSVYDLCRDGSNDLNLWREKCGDSINYLLILLAMVEENQNIKY